MKYVSDHKVSDYNVGDLVEHTLYHDLGIVVEVNLAIAIRVQWKSHCMLSKPRYLRILSKVRHV